MKDKKYCLKKLGNVDLVTGGAFCDLGRL